MGAYVDHAELARDVEAEGLGVGHADLEQHARGVVGVDEELVEQLGREAGATLLGAYGDAEQVDDVAGAHRHAVAGQGARGVLRDDEAPPGALDLLPDERLVPGVGAEQLVLERGEAGQVGQGGGTDHETGFLGAPATASGRRR